MPGRAGAPEEDEALIGELIEEFRRVPDGWKEMVVEQVALVRRMAERPPYRFIGGEEEGLDDAGQVSDETAAQAA